ncbi:MAG: PDZ domain-containing protein, partial [Clostridia bacterium]|nr:PDZ domain-containing protein [Clostridia bacterium]
LRQALAEDYAAGYGDPYAAYYTAEEYADIKQALEGTYTGFGIEVEVNGSALVVSAVYSDSAAEAAGIQKQDVITAVDEERVMSVNLESVQRRLENPAKLLLSINRDGTPHSFTLSPTTISLDNVENTMLSDGTTGYVRIRRLADNTPAQFRSAMSVLSEAGATQYVLDLRDNDGGSLDAALEILEYLLPRGSFARLNAGDKRDPVVYSSHAASQLTDRLVVLVNQNTEAEAELIAGALQEGASASLIGTVTKGHARMQSYFTLESGNAAVRVSVGTLELLEGGSWEGKGLTPDREVTLSGDIHFSLRQEAEDDQLQAALVMLNGVGTEATTTVASTTGTGTTAATTGGTTGTTKK